MVRRLSKEEYLQTFRPPMRNVTGTERSVIDIWPYVNEAIAADLPQCDPDGVEVELVYRSSDDLFEHVLLPTGEKNVYMVLIVSLRADAVLGHRILDLNQEYGLDSVTSA